MAQAPPKQAGPNPDRKQDTKTHFSITDCPICLESLRKPKSLPCLHTFCQECLSIYIIGRALRVNTCFECPICRRKTLPTQPASPLDTWASQFPTNNFVIEMMKTLKSEESTAQMCQPCSNRQNEIVHAMCWCQDCGFFLCETCHDGHNLVWYQHKVFSMEELSQHPMVLIPTQPTCTEHSEKLSLICLNHDILGCHMCIAIEHRRCDDVTSVTKYAESLRSKETCSKFNKDMDKNIEDIDYVIFKFRSKLDTVSQDKDKALRRLTDAKEWFDDQHSKLTEEVMNMHKDETQLIKNKLASVEAVRTSMLQTKAMKETAQDENQLVTTVMRGKSEMSRCEEIVKKKDDKTVRINVRFKNEFENLMKARDAIGSTFPQMFGRKATLIGTIPVPCEGNITGMIVLPNKTLIVSDHFKKQLLLLKESGVKIANTPPLGGFPWGLCQMPNGEIAAAVSGENKISIIRVSLSQLSVVRDIRLGIRPYDITYFNGALHTASPSVLHRVSDDGTITQLQTLPTTSYMYSITTMKDGQLIGSIDEKVSTKSAIYKVSSGNIYSEVIKANLAKEARGVAVDDENNIYVCCFGSNNVYQISADESTTTEILTSDDISGPFAVNICGEKLYVCEYSRENVKVFKLE